MILSIINPSELSLLIILLCIHIGSSLVILFFVQKYCSWLNLRDGGIFGTIFGNTMPTLVGFIFAFVTVAAWQNHNNVGDTVSKEAHTLFNLYQILDAYPKDLKIAGQTQLIAYTQDVINQEWPKLNEKQFNLDTSKKLDQINFLFVNHKPSSFGELALHNEGLRLLSTYRDLRRDRIESAKSFIDKPLWGALVLSAYLLLLYSAFFKTRNIRIHSIMMALVGASLGVMFFLLTIYDNPFRGPSAIEPIPFQEILYSISILQKQ